MISANLRREIRCFIVAGVIATLTDFIVYWFLHAFLSFSLAKTISFICGSVVAYLLNKFITFKKHERSVNEAVSFILLYTFTLVVNVAVNSGTIYVVSGVLPVSQAFILVFAFLTATGVSTIINFLGQRLWVFKVVG